MRGSPKKRIRRHDGYDISVTLARQFVKHALPVLKEKSGRFDTRQQKVFELRSASFRISDANNRDTIKSKDPSRTHALP